MSRPHCALSYCEGSEPYIAHGSIGSEMLRQYGAAHNLDLEVYALICERHTGSGITAAEVAAQGLPITVKDYLPLSNEEKLITLADKFFSKSGNMAEKPLSRIRASMAEFGAASLERFDALCDLFGVDHAEN